MIITITSDYLWLGVSRKAEVRKLHFFCNKKKIKEIDIRLTDEEPEYYVLADLSRFAGQKLEITGDFPENLFKGIHLSDEKPVNTYAYRPVLHFTPEIGWMNDPNGLIYADGVYHLYHQWNPYGTDWGNMHWGHAVSRDLIHWEYGDMAMEPDEYGTMFSGCAFQDTADAAGFGRNTLLFYYTAAGGANLWSRDTGHQFSQHLAVSKDQGETLVKQGEILPHIDGGNRDPKVFYHEESGAYIMVLYVTENDFAIFRSRDLLHWEESQRFTAEKMWECPDLMQLPVDNVAGEKKWVFWSADGYYIIGDFDGYRFTPESEILSAYDTKLPYAAQTYAGIPGKVISIAWLRTQNDRGNFRSMMSIPSVLSLEKLNDGYHIRFTPAEALFSAFKREECIKPLNGSLTLAPEGRPVFLKTTWQPGYEKKIRIGDQEICITTACTKVNILVDHGIIEYFSGDGLVYGAVEAEEDVLNKAISMGEGVTETTVCSM